MHTQIVSLLFHVNILYVKLCIIPCNGSRYLPIPKILEKGKQQCQLMSDMRQKLTGTNLCQDRTKYSFEKFCALVLKTILATKFLSHTLSHRQDRHFLKIDDVQEIPKCVNLSKNRSQKLLQKQCFLLFT